MGGAGYIQHLQDFRTPGRSIQRSNNRLSETKILGNLRTLNLGQVHGSVRVLPGGQRLALPGLVHDTARSLDERIHRSIPRKHKSKTTEQREVCCKRKATPTTPFHFKKKRPMSGEKRVQASSQGQGGWARTSELLNAHRIKETRKLSTGRFASKHVPNGRTLLYASLSITTTLASESILHRSQSCAESALVQPY